MMGIGNSFIFKLDSNNQIVKHGSIQICGHETFHRDDLLPYFYDLGIVEDCDIKPNSISHIGNFY
jgi:hypothetical protein